MISRFLETASRPGQLDGQEMTLSLKVEKEEKDFYRLPLSL